MKEFLNINHRKILAGFALSSILFTGVFIVVFLFNYIKSEKLPENKFTILTFFACSIFFPVFVMIIRTIKGFQNYFIHKGIIETYPFNELSNHGFEKVYVNKESRFKLTQIKLLGKYNNYPMSSKYNKMVFTMSVFVSNKLTFEHIKMLQKEIGENKINRNWYGIDLNYNFYQERITSHEQIISDLDRITSFLQREGVFPETNNQL